MAAATLERDSLEDREAGDACPHCDGDVVNVQGILACADCGHNSA